MRLTVLLRLDQAVENDTDAGPALSTIYDLKTSHLTPSRSDFFKKWDSLISLEEGDLVRFKKELWTMRAKEREDAGRCFASMVMDPHFSSSTGDADKGSILEGREGKIHRHTYRFVRSRTPGSSVKSLLHGHMGPGDATTISVEPNLLALARGFILSLDTESVVIGVDHALSEANIRSRLAVGEGASKGQPVVFRIDKDELFGGMGRLRENLANVFYADGDTKRLELVVDLRPPVFNTKPLPVEVKLPRALNPSQRRAIMKALSAQDYSLILGMPGTGKTTVIVTLIRTLVKMGKSVLLTSYTHSAVDTILAKLTNAKFSILRLGNVDKASYFPFCAYLGGLPWLD